MLITGSSSPVDKQKNLSESDLELSNLKSFGSGETGSTQEKRSEGDMSLNRKKKGDGDGSQDPWDMI
jgi:hypothetical protein